MERSIITLTTDFGTKDGYVAVMKGVILNINPETLIVDISHEIPHHDIVEARYIVERTYGYFPEKTIHLAVVDPGVGGTRRPILIITERYMFIGPDNGIFGFVLHKERVQKIIELTNSKYFLGPISNTFHGRDIFAACAGYISLGLRPERLGPEIDSIMQLPDEEPVIKDNGILGRIKHVDRFGNLISNIRKADLEKLMKKGSVEILVGNKVLRGIRDTYSSVSPGELLALIGSTDCLEIAVNMGNASDKLSLKRGDQIIVMLRDERIE